MSPAAELVLDREVRDWVLLPLTACVLLMQLLRQYVTQVGRAGARGTVGAFEPAHRRHRRRPASDTSIQRPPPRPPLAFCSCSAGPR